MRSASYQQSSYTQQASLRRRATGFVVTILANALLIIMLLRMAPTIEGVPLAKREAATFQLLPERRAAAARTVAKVKPAGEAAGRRKPLPPPIVTTPAAPASPLNMLTLSREEFAASDISRLPSHRDDSASGAANGAATDGPSDSAVAPGQGPNGERLYQAEWYRRPTHAELAYYLPAGNTQSGWGMIACQTVEKHHVDNCRELGDSPPGSGLARAIRQAAWQFLVLPPRIGGRQMVGAWVSIRIDYSQESAK